MYCRLEVSYPLAGDDYLDSDIKKAVGTESSDSGHGFGRRDLGWIYDNIDMANAAAERVRALDIEEIDIDVSEYPDEDDA